LTGRVIPVAVVVVIFVFSLLQHATYALVNCCAL
jgi:hypothetical protein